MGDWWSKGLDPSYDTAIWAKLDPTEIEDELDEVYYYNHSSDKKSYMKRADQKLDSKKNISDDFIFVGDSRSSYHGDLFKRITPNYTDYSGTIAL